MTKHMTLQGMYKRDEAIWRVFTECGWTMQELADLHHLTKGAIFKILVLSSKRHGMMVNA